MLRLKGQMESGEWVEFDIPQVYDVCLYDNRWYIKEYHNEIPINCVTYIIDPTTIQLADDPRKNILDEAKYKIEHLEAGPPVELYRKGYYSAVIEALQILDELEAKL